MGHFGVSEALAGLTEARAAVSPRMMQLQLAATVERMPLTRSLPFPASIIGTLFVLLVSVADAADGNLSRIKADSGLLPGQPLSSALRSFTRARALTAAGRDEDSARILQSLLGTSDPHIDREVRVLLMRNERSRFRYRSALAVIAPILRNNDPSLRNQASLLEALSVFPPQKIEPGAKPDLRLPSFQTVVSVGRSHLYALIDTGSDFSALGRSAARMAGLRIGHLGYDVVTASDRTTSADLAVGQLVISSIKIDNVVFLILPDRAFEHEPVSAVIGLPVLRQLALEIGQANRIPVSGEARLSFADESPFLAISVSGERIKCKLDTGAARSTFVKSKLPARAFEGERAGRKWMFVTDAGGRTRRLEGYNFTGRISVAGRSVTLPDALGVSEPSPTGGGCVLGRDAIVRLEPVTIDFRSMKLLVR